MEIVVFTNGCFDILHPGHVELLKKARQLGTKLIVGLNSDRSVRAIKGSPRPFFNQDARAELLRELRSVDEVRIFNENTPESLIKEIKPDVLVKGGDWSPEQIVGAAFVLRNGGKVFSIPFESDYSSSKIVEKIKNAGNLTTSAIQKESDGTNFVETLINDYIENFQNLLKTEVSNILLCAAFIQKTFESGNKILFCGDEEDALLTQNLAEKFSNFGGKCKNFNKFEVKSIKTNQRDVLENSPERSFSEQIRANAQTDDLLIAVNPSGKSSVVISAVMQARQMNCKTIGLTGTEGKKIASLCDANVSINYKNPDQIPAIISAVVDIWCEVIDFNLKKQRKIQNGLIK